MNITLTYSELTATVKRSLSIIGKRSVDENGNLLFKDITLSSLEEPILGDYFRQAIIDITTGTESFVTASATQSITLTFPTNHNDALDSAITDVCKDYCVSYALYSWFQVTAPRLTEKYLADCNRQMGALIKLIHNKKAPASETSYSEVTGTITQQ